MCWLVPVPVGVRVPIVQALADNAETLLAQNSARHDIDLYKELFKHSRLSCPTQTFSVILLAPLSNAEEGSGYMFGYIVHVKDQFAH
jgi:hypothetical protein